MLYIKSQSMRKVYRMLAQGFTKSVPEPGSPDEV
jgi:hypothetical protein